VSGDTAYFQSRPINSASTDVTVGASGDVNPEFGLILVAEKIGSGEMIEIDVFRCKGVGLPFGFAEKAFSEPKLTIKAFQDTTRNGVFSYRRVVPSTLV